MKLIDKVYVLHVKKGFKDRAIHIKNELAKHHIEFYFILDWDIPDLKKDILSKYIDTQHSLDLPNQSIIMKHIEVLKKIVQNKYAYTLVFEDDVFLSINFNEIIEKIFIEIQNKKIHEGIIISLGNAGNCYVDPNILIPNQFLYPNSRHRAADSYLIDFKAAQKRLEWFEKNTTIHTAGHMYNYIDKEVNNSIYWLHPTIVEQGSQNGTMRSSVSRNKFLHKYRWLWRDLIKKRKFYIYSLKKLFLLNNH